MNIEVVRATVADAADLSVVLQGGATIKATHNDDIWGSHLFNQQEVEELMGEGDLYLARLNQEPAGCVLLKWEDERIWGAEGLDGQAGYIHKLSRLSGEQYKGLGGLLMRWVEDEVKERGKHYLRLDCPSDNIDLCDYYANSGFHYMGRVVLPGRTPDLPPYDAATFERRIA